MKKWVLLLCISVCLTSCSYLTEFYIFNTTDEVITITYKTKTTELYHPFVTTPRIHAFRSVKKIDKKKVANASIKRKDSLTIVATLQPKQALWIGVESNFILKNERPLLEENLDYVTITDASGTKNYSASEISSRFKEFTYEIVGITVE